MNAADRLLSKCAPEPMTGCWLWFGSSQPTGYGAMWDGSKVDRAHRIAYRLFIGEIPRDAEIDHLCRQRCCVNPLHLRAVTHRENMRASNTVMGINARKSACKRGHELSGANLRITPTGARQCRTCQRDYARNKRAGRGGVFQ